MSDTRDPSPMFNESNGRRMPRSEHADARRTGRRTAADSSQQQHGISVVELFSMLRRWWWQCGLAGGLVAVIAVSVVWLTFTPTYEASAWLEIKSESPYIAFPDRSNSQLFAQTQLETIRSAIVLSRVASKDEISLCPESREGLPPEQWLAKGLKVGYVGQSELCEVRFRSKNPQGAAAVANEVVAEYLALNQDHSSEQTERIIKLLEEQQRERKAEVESQREKVRTLTKKTTGHDPVVLGDDHKKVLPRNPYLEAEEQRIAAEVDVALLQAELKALEEGLADKTIEAPVAELRKLMDAHPELQRLRDHAAMLRRMASEYKQAAARGANDPKAIAKAKEADKADAAMQKRIADLEPQLRKELEVSQRTAQGQAAQELKHELDRAINTRNVWEQRAREQREEMEKHGDDALMLEFARGDLERSEQVHSRIAERIIALKTEKLAPTRAASRKEATVPLRPVEEVPYRNMALAGLGVFCLPFGLAFLWERWMRRISDSSRIVQESSLTVLGEIAALPSRVSSVVDHPNDCLRDRVTFEESVDALRVALTLTNDFRDVQILVITSAVSREGKTNLALALAISLAHSFREPVLLIDSDMRAPDLHEMFNTSLVPGLAEVLGRECLPGDALARRLTENVDFLPAGRLATSPHALLRNGAFSALLEEFRPHYRYIVVDSPPVLSASEAMVIANACDGALICTRCDFSRAYQLRLASERLAASGARLLGAVINAVPTRLWAYRYGGYGYGWERYGAPRAAARRIPAFESPKTGFDSTAASSSEVN